MPNSARKLFKVLIPPGKGDIGVSRVGHIVRDILRYWVLLFSDEPFLFPSRVKSDVALKSICTSTTPFTSRFTRSAVAQAVA